MLKRYLCLHLPFSLFPDSQYTCNSPVHSHSSVPESLPKRRDFGERVTNYAHADAVRMFQLV